MNATPDRMKLTAIGGFILLAVLSRLALPPIFGHSPNFAPMDAIALFSGAYYGRKLLGFLLPLLAIWLSDIVVNFGYYHHLVLFYDGFYWQYASYLLMVLMGSSLLKTVKIPRVLAGSMAASLIFFIVSNFGAFTTAYYPHTLAGLGACYLAGLPFFSHTILSDLIYCAYLFGIYETVRQRLPVLAKAS